MNSFLFDKDNGGHMPNSIRFLIIFLSIMAFQLCSTVQAQTVTLNLKNATLARAADEINKQTKYDFSFNDRILRKAKPVTLKLNKEPLANALKMLFADQPLSYEIKDRMIIIVEKAGSNNGSDDKALQSTVNGRVTNENGAPLEGAVVSVKGSKFNTKTDKDGKFSVPGQYADSKLVIHHMGYSKMEIPAQRARVITLSMSSSELDNIDVVVNTGYQQIDKRNLTSAVQTIKMDSILVPGINTIDKLLEGRVPGMIFMQNSGQVGAAPRLRIRGTSTVLGNREPLWVLDGVVLSDPVNVDPQQLNDLDFVNLLGNAISGLNPQDIDQIDVLKDASATALYGARAGNGVIVITTKKGKPGKPTISYNAATTFTQRPRYSDRSMYMMNSSERLDVSREMVERGMQYNTVTQFSGYEAAVQDYYKGSISYAEFKRLSDYYGGVNTDWLGLLTKDTFSQTHNLSLSGGSNDIKYYASMGYQNENGSIKGENGKRYSSMLNITADYKKFMAQITFNGNYSTRDYTPADLGVLNYAYNTSRTLPAYNPDGSYFFYPRVDNLSTTNFNILNDKSNANDHTNLIAANVKALVKYRILPLLNVEATFAYGVSSNVNEIYYTKDSYYINKLRNDRAVRNDLAPIGGEFQHKETRNNNYLARFQTNYVLEFGKDNKHSFSAAAGLELKSNAYNGFAINRRGYFRELGGYFDPISTTYSGYYNQFMSTKEGLGSFQRQLTNDLAWFGTAGYSWDNRYILNVHMRGEQSNLFGSRSNEKFLPIWAVSGRWNAKQDVLQDVSWVNELAVKASYGWQGNMLPGQTPYMIIKQDQFANPYYNVNAATISNYPNPDLKWERTASSNFGVDFSLFGNKVSGSVSYFYKRTEDAFLSKTVSEINGVTNYIVNSGTLENKGVELSLSFTAINNVGANKSRRGFVWRFDPQLGQVLNNVINRAINNRNNLLIDNITYANFLNGSIQLAGKPLNTFYSYKFKGLSPVDGSPIFYGLEPEQKAEYQKKYGNMKPEDVYLAVMSESGRREPYIQGGLSNYFGYRNFGLSFNLTYSLGNKIRLMKIASGYSTTTIYPNQNLRKEFVQRWRRPGDENFTSIPGLQANNAYNQSWWEQYPATDYRVGGNLYDLYDNSDLRLVSADHLKLQSVSLRYNVAESFTKKLGIGTAYVSIAGTNLFIISSKQLKGQDPTQSGSTPNISLSLRPTYSGSINVSF